jgi:hypothetical protein
MLKSRSGFALVPAAAAVLGTLAIAAPAAASPPPWAPAHGWRDAPPPQVIYVGDRRHDNRKNARQSQRAYEQGYRDALRQQQWNSRHAGWNQPRYEPYPADWSNARPLNRRDVVWRGRDGQAYCRRNDGTTGVVIGAIAGGTLGNVIAGDGQRRLGSILGGSLGAILGRELDRGNLRCY